MQTECQSVDRLIRQIAWDGDLVDRLPEFTQALRMWSDCTQAGVCLRLGNAKPTEDYPFSLSGIVPAAAETLSWLAVEHGSSLETGRVAQSQLACWCGHMLRQGAPSGDPTGTAFGSFRLNDAASPAGDVNGGRCPPPCVRAHCRAEHCRSLALIPVRTPSKAFGLLYLSDRRADRFAPGFMACLETLADHLAMALACRKAEAALRDSENRFRTLLCGIPSVAFQKYDPDGIVQDWNAASERLYGYTAAEAIGRNLKELIIPAELHATFDETVRQMVATTQPNAPGEFLLMRKNGTRVPVFCGHTIIPVPGHAPELYSVDIDLSQRQRLEQERLIAETRRQQVNKTKSLGRMAGAVAHHFNNQLQVIMGNLEAGIDGWARGADIHDALCSALNAARKAANISSRMLTVAGQSPVDNRYSDLSKLCDQAVSTLREKIPRHVTMETAFPSSGPWVQVAATNIQLILSNLVTNAWEAIGDDKAGVIRVAVSLADRNEIPLWYRVPTDWDPRQERYACLAVSDTGCGIDQTEIGNIVDPFYSSKFIGRGMGLAEIQGILHGCDGGFTIDGTPAGGSVFRVFLPAFDAPEVHPVPVQSAAAAIDSDTTILLVEDDPQVLGVTEAMLHRLGVDVICACDGEQAVRFFREHQSRIRLVLCDVSMPQMDGWQTLGALRRLVPDLPVILTSGYSESEVMQGLHSEQPQVFLRKPYRLPDLESAVMTCLQLAHDLAGRGAPDPGASPATR